MSIDVGRIRAIAHKELREYRRNRFIIGTMGFLPVVFMIVPLIDLFRIPATAPSVRVQAGVGTALLLLLIVPVIIPASIAAYSVVGERDQGTLEPVLATPIRREELLLGKALAAILPAVGMAYALFAIVVLSVRLGASAAVVDAIWQAPQFLAQILFAPLLAGWAIWIGMAVSARASDVRVAQQLGTLASLPALGLTSLLSFGVLTPSVGLAAILAGALAVVDVAAWRVVSALFDRERLLTGASAGRRAG